MSFVSVQSLLNDIVTVHSVSSNTLRMHRYGAFCTISRWLPQDFHASGMKTPPGTVACVQ